MTRPKGRRLAVFSALAASAALVVAPPASAERPNLLVVVTDDQRAEGTLQVMDSTTRWLADGGTTFNSAYATTPLCCPSRATIFSGQYAHNHGVFRNDDVNRLNQDQTVQSRLDRAGYTTGIVGKFLNNEPLDQRPRHWDDYRITDGLYYGSAWNENGRRHRVTRYITDYTELLARNFIRAREQDDDQPWFLYVATTAAHAPVIPEPKYLSANVGELAITPGIAEADISDKPAFWEDLVAKNPPPPGSTGADIRRQQLRTLLSVDDLVATLRAELRSGRELRDTFIVFTSDNGLLWGEHGGPTIKDLPWLESSRIPLIVAWPRRVEAGVVDRSLVGNVDLAPTLLDAAGLRKPRWMDGYSVLSAHERSELLLEYGGLRNLIPAWRGLTAPGWQYTEYDAIAGFASEREFYDLGVDPAQLHNRLGDAESSGDPATAALARRLAAYAACAGSSCP